MAKWVSLTALPMLLIGSFAFADNYKKLEPINSDSIVRFTLFNYDRIVQDHFEGRSDYLDSLFYLVQSSEKISSSDIQSVLQDDDLYTESNPVQFMVRMNQKLKFKSGYYFIDD